MAKARARGNRKVLSRQEVARSKGGAGAQPEGGYVRDILAVFTFIGSVALFCALFTYSRDDSTAAEVQNLIGPVGHAAGLKLFGTLGVCAYLVPIALLYTSIALFVRGRKKRRGRQIAGVIGLALSGAVLAHLLVGTSPEWNYAPGGAVGAVIGETLRSLFSTFGAALVMVAVAFGSLIVATDSAFARLCVAIGGLLASSARSVGAWVIAEGRRQLELLRQRREQARRERLAEEAAFAQALADAEEAEAEAELHAASYELDAAEAEAVAEEAARLAREAEERRARQTAEEKAREAALLAARKVRMMPDADPAWARPPSRPPQPAEPVAPAVITPAPEAPAPEPPARAKPIIALPPTPSQPPQPAVAEPAAAPVPAQPAAAETAAARPLIVEPKAIPRPARAKEEKKDPFAFESGSKFALPPISLLEMTDEQRSKSIDKEIYFAIAERLREKLASFGIDGVVKEIRPGPVVTMYEFEPAPGIKISKIASLADDLAMAMEAVKVRIIAPIPGKGVVGIEVPNRERETVYLKEIVEQEVFAKSQSKLTLALGKNIEGMPYVTDLAKMPHVLIAGTTGSGKSVSVNAMIMSMLLKSTPEEVRFIMVDPKVTELSIYEGIPHLLLPVVTDPRKAAMALRWGVEEMERRYQLLADAGVRNIAGYNKWVERISDEIDAESAKAAAAPAAEAEGEDRKIRIIDVAEGEGSGEAPTLGVAAPSDEEEIPEHLRLTPEEIAEDRREELAAAMEEAASPPEAPKEKEKEKPRKLPYIVIIIDEVADLMMVASREVETYVARLAQMARAAGIHLMIATQRPSTDVITGVIKANFPSRISFMLRSKPDSMTILGTVGAEALLGMGDMLILPPTSAHLERVHGAFVSDAEIQKVVDHLKAQGKPVYDESILRPRDEDGEGGGSGPEEHNDEMYDQCLAIVSEMRQVSVSMLQRKLRLGYNRAARIIERMEREGVVGPANGSKPREVLIRPAGQMHNEINV